MVDLPRKEGGKNTVGTNAKCDEKNCQLVVSASAGPVLEMVD